MFSPLFYGMLFDVSEIILDIYSIGLTKKKFLVNMKKYFQDRSVHGNFKM